ncbi:unnamed protein product, partial [Ectocarpus sp. 12 AP-2014]
MLSFAREGARSTVRRNGQQQPFRRRLSTAGLRWSARSINRYSSRRLRYVQPRIIGAAAAIGTTERPYSQYAGAGGSAWPAGAAAAAATAAAAAGAAVLVATSASSSNEDTGCSAAAAVAPGKAELPVVRGLFDPSLGGTMADGSGGISSPLGSFGGGGGGAGGG